MGKANKSLLAASVSHEQDGRHAHTWQKHFKHFFSRTSGPVSTNLGI